MPRERPSPCSVLCGIWQHKPQATPWLTAGSVPLMGNTEHAEGCGALVLGFPPSYVPTYTHMRVHKSPVASRCHFHAFPQLQDYMPSKQKCFCSAPSLPSIQELILVNTLRQFIAVPLHPYHKNIAHGSQLHWSVGRARGHSTTVPSQQSQPATSPCPLTGGVPWDVTPWPPSCSQHSANACHGDRLGYMG